MPDITYDVNYVQPENVSPYFDLIKAILSPKPELRPSVKQMRGLTYHGLPVFRAKTNYKERLIYTYSQGKMHILRILEDHDYKKLKRQLASKQAASAAVATASFVIEPPVLLDPNEPIKLMPSVAYNQMELIISDEQHEVIKAKTPLIIAGAPGVGKTVLLFIRMLCSAIKSHDLSLPILFISQSESLLKKLASQYDQIPDEKPVIHFVVWKNFLKSEYPAEYALFEQDVFANWLKENSTELVGEPHDEVHYEFSLLKTLGNKKYHSQGARQSYYSSEAGKQKEIARLLPKWQAFLNEKKLIDPMVARIPKALEYASVFCDEAQNLPPIALLDLVLIAKEHQRFVACLDTEQCLLSSPFIHNCLKEILHEHYGSYSEHILDTTWRCPIKIAAAADSVMNVKHKHAPEQNQRRSYKKINAAKSEEGHISWVTTKHLKQLAQYGKSANTVVLSEVALSAADSKLIEKEVDSSNIISASQAIGLDYKIVILWKYFSSNEHFESLYKKWRTKKPFELTLNEMMALNALFVALTRAELAVFIYDIDDRWLTFAQYVIGNFDVNKFNLLLTKLTAEQEKEKWKKDIDHHLISQQIDIAKNLMKKYLSMGDGEIEEYIKHYNKENSIVLVEKKPSIEPTKKKKGRVQNQSDKLQAGSAAATLLAPVPAPAKKTSTVSASVNIRELSTRPTEEKLIVLFQHKNFSSLLFQGGSATFKAILGHSNIVSFFLSKILENWNDDLSLRIVTEINSNNSVARIKLFNQLMSTEAGCQIVKKLFTHTGKVQVLKLFQNHLTNLAENKNLSASFGYLSLSDSGRKLFCELMDDAPRVSTWDNADFMKAVLKSAPIELLCEPLKQGSLIYQLSKTESGCQSLIDLLERKNEELDNAIFVDTILSPGDDKRNQPEDESALYWLSCFENGNTFLQKFIDKFFYYKETNSNKTTRLIPLLIKNMTASHLCLMRNSKAGKLANTSPLFFLLARSSAITSDLFLAKPELAKELPVDFLNRVAPGNISPLHYCLSKKNEDYVAIAHLKALFDLNPQLLTNISEEIIFENSDYWRAFADNKWHHSMFFYLYNNNGFNVFTRINYFVCLLWPAIASHFSQEKLCSLSALTKNHDNDEYNQKYPSPLHVFAADKLYLSAADYPNLVQAVSGEALFRKHAGTFPFHLFACSKHGRRFLLELLKSNPEIAQFCTLDDLLQLHDSKSRKRDSEIKKTSLLYQLSKTGEGCEVLCLLVQHNPTLLKGVTVEHLIAYHGNPRDHRPVMSRLAESNSGMHFINLLLDGNPSCFNKETDKLFPFHLMLTMGNGVDHLLKMLKSRPEIARQLDAKALTQVHELQLRGKVQKSCRTSLLTQLIVTMGGYDVLNWLLTQDKKLFQDITGEDLILSAAANGYPSVSSLISHPLGKKFLVNLLTKNTQCFTAGNLSLFYLIVRLGHPKLVLNLFRNDGTYTIRKYISSETLIKMNELPPSIEQQLSSNGQEPELKGVLLYQLLMTSDGCEILNGFMHLLEDAKVIEVLSKQFSTLFHGLVVHKPGRKILETLLTKYPALAESVNAKITCKLCERPACGCVKHNYSDFSYIKIENNKYPSLYFLSLTKSGRRILNMLLMNNKDFANDFTAESLMTEYENVNALMRRSSRKTLHVRSHVTPWHCLVSSMEGQKFLVGLLNANHELAANIKLEKKDIDYLFQYKALDVLNGLIRHNAKFVARLMGKQLVANNLKPSDAGITNHELISGNEFVKPEEAAILASGSSSLSKSNPNVPPLEVLKSPPPTAVATDGEAIHADLSTVFLPDQGSDTAVSVSGVGLFSSSPSSRIERSSSGLEQDDNVVEPQWVSAV